jgi:uncharacterized membrane protein YgcG
MASLSTPGSPLPQPTKSWLKYKMFKKDIRRLQGGTGKHLDGAVDGPIDEGGRPFQAQVVLKSQVPGDGSLQVVPGFHWFASKYFHKADARSVPPGEYYALREEVHSTMLTHSLWWYVKRVPKEWSMLNKKAVTRPNTCEGIARACLTLKNELEEMPPSLLPQEGDYILWDPRLLHSTGETNELNCTGQIRQTFYCAYRPFNASTQYIAKEQLAYRSCGQHPAWGASSHWKAEESVKYSPLELDELGKKLYYMIPWEKKLTTAERRERRAAKRIASSGSGSGSGRTGKKHAWENTGRSSGGSGGSSTTSDETTRNIKRHLTPQLLSFFKRYGFVVVPNVISVKKTSTLREEISDFVWKKYQIDISSEKSAEDTLTMSNLKRMISSYGSGMVELFWLHGMDAIRTDVGTYGVFSDLLRGKLLPFR